MSSYPRLSAGKTPSRKEMRCARRIDISSDEYAPRVCEVISKKLKDLIVDGKRIMRNDEMARALKSALKENGLFDTQVKLACGEVHVGIGAYEDVDHGHVIVPLDTQAARYSRGYNKPKGPQNCILPAQ